MREPQRRRTLEVERVGEALHELTVVRAVQQSQPQARRDQRLAGSAPRLGSTHLELRLKADAVDLSLLRWRRERSRYRRRSDRSHASESKVKGGRKRETTVNDSLVGERQAAPESRRMRAQRHRGRLIATKRRGQRHREQGRDLDGTAGDDIEG